jgi:hypothetical protein
VFGTSEALESPVATACSVQQVDTENFLYCFHINCPFRITCTCTKSSTILSTKPYIVNVLTALGKLGNELASTPCPYTSVVNVHPYFVGVGGTTFLFLAPAERELAKYFSCPARCSRNRRE